jgi:hypothetical protein
LGSTSIGSTAIAICDFEFRWKEVAAAAMIALQPPQLLAVEPQETSLFPPLDPWPVMIFVSCLKKQR